MPIIKDPHLFNEQSLFVDLEGVLGCRLYLKIEGFNFAGSIFMPGGSTGTVVHRHVLAHRTREFLQ
jgi:hypothetical protein